MADESRPYKVVVEALAAQTVAIGRLAKEIKIEFAQYQNAQAAGDEAKANRIAAAINSRTEKLSALADELAASVPDAEVGGGPATPPPVIGGGPIEPPFTPGDPVDRPGGQPDRPVAPDQPPGGGGRPDTGPVRPGRPTDPDYGIGSERPGTGPVRPGGGDPDYGIDAGGGVTGKPDQGLPTPPPVAGQPLPGDQPEVGGGPARPGRPTDPDYGVGSERPGGGPARPGRPTDPDYGVGTGGGVTGKPDQGLPEGPGSPNLPGQGLPPTPPAPDQSLPEGEDTVDNTLPDVEGQPKPSDDPKPEHRKGSPKG